MESLAFGWIARFNRLIPSHCGVFLSVPVRGVFDCYLSDRESPSLLGTKFGVSDQQPLRLCHLQLLKGLPGVRY